MGANGHGGFRRGAGAKRKLRVFAAKDKVESVLRKLGKPYKGTGLPGLLSYGQILPAEDDLWISLLLSPDQRIRMHTLMYLKDRVEGKPSQEVSHTVEHLIAAEEGRHLARKMLALKNRKTIEVTPDKLPEASEAKQEATGTDDASRTPRDP